VQEFAYIYDHVKRKVKNERILEVVSKSGKFPPAQIFFNTKDADAFKNKAIDAEVGKHEGTINKLKGIIKILKTGKFSHVDSTK